MMATAPSTGVRISGRIWTTPQILWRALIAVWVCDAAVLALLLVAGHIQYSALRAIGKDSAPSIIASQQIKSSLSDMDADAANELLSGSDAQQDYNARRRQGAAALIAAAQNITYGDSERIPILRIQLDLGTYETLIQRARDLRKEGDPTFLSFYNQAAQLLDDEILPAAGELDAANLNELNAAYSRQQSSSVISRMALSCAWLFFFVLLIAVQVFLFRRTKRLINVPLFAATFLLVISAALTLGELKSADVYLKRAKEDAFTSIHALWQARALAYAANADESRFLLDPAHAAQRTQDFYAKKNRLLKREGSSQSGYLADELNNITFEGEREAADETVRVFGRYLGIDSQIRSLEAQHQHQAAIKLCTGTAPGESDWAFQQFDDALGRTLKINQLAFDQSIANGFNLLQYFDVKTVAVAVLLAILSLFGLLSRIREYL